VSVPRRAATLAIVGVVVLLARCSADVRPAIAPGIDACRECGMLIDRAGQACGYAADGEFLTFDSPICLLRSYESRASGGKQPPTSVYFADYRDGSLHPAEDMAFLLTDQVSTVMSSGVLCFASRGAAEQARTREDERITDWSGFLLRRGTPDRELEVTFGPDGMTPGAVEANRDELLLWKVRARGLPRDLEISIRGYPELGEVAVPASGDEVQFRMKVTRPGKGFPVVSAEGGDPLGVLNVLGAHTPDEEQR